MDALGRCQPTRSRSIRTAHLTDSECSAISLTNIVYEEDTAAADVYESLAKHLGNLPAGFPRTESGVELRILRRIFSPEDAKLALHFSLIPEEPRVISRGAKIPEEEAAQRLEEMDKKGLIFSYHREGGPTEYQARQFVVGFWEGQLNKLSPELVQNSRITLRADHSGDSIPSR